jgi:cytochrome b subunit of formate dehydrogenase
MTRRVVHELIRRENRFNTRSRFNLIVNTLIGISFLITALSGIYLLFFPAGRNGVIDPGFLVTRTTWDLIHTWAGILLIIAGIVHFAIHWRWIVKVTGKMLKVLWPIPEQRSELESAKALNS